MVQKGVYDTRQHRAYGVMLICPHIQNRHKMAMVAYALESRVQTRMDECSRFRFIRDTSSRESIHLMLEEGKIMKEAG